MSNYVFGAVFLLCMFLFVNLGHASGSIAATERASADLRQPLSPQEEEQRLELRRQFAQT